MRKHFKIMAISALFCAVGVMTGCNEGEDRCDICETMTDSHDGTVYKTVKIGDQVWMAENLNVVMEDSWCYADKPDNCKKYGRLYTWEMAKSACPEGWHLPSKDEFETLFATVGGQPTAGKMLKSKKGWKKSGNITNEFFFSALPTGLRLSEGKYLNEGTYAYFWSSTEYGDGSAYNMYLDNGSDRGNMFDDVGENGRSVRCLKN
jgi:uncharacterized protein (TIGR02145 family)